MAQVTERPVRVRFEHTLYGHWGGRSGYARFTDKLEPTRVRTELHGAADSDEVPSWLRPLKPWLRRAIRRRPMKWYKLSDLVAESRALLACLLGRCDVVHFLDGEHSGQFLPRLLKLGGAKVRTVASFHQPPDLLEEILGPAPPSSFDHIVLMSPSQRSYFKGRVADEKISVILHGVDADFFRPAAEDRAPDAPLRCVTVGHWLRDWVVFRSVAERLPAVQFHAVTGGDTGSDDLPNVFRHQGITDEALASLYRSADILFLPLHDCTANNALLEGIASGLPVVATDLESVRAYLPGDEGLLPPPGDVDATVAAIERLQKDVELRRRMGASARSRAEALSWERVALQYEALFTRLRDPGEPPAVR